MDKGFFGAQFLGEDKQDVAAEDKARGVKPDDRKILTVLPVLQGDPPEFCKHWGGGLFRPCKAGFKPIDKVKHGEVAYYRYDKQPQVFREDMSSPCNRRFNFHGATCPHANFDAQCPSKTTTNE